MKKFLIIYLIAFLCSTGKLFSQVKIGNNPTTIGSGSLLELESTNKGLVLPRMTGAQMNAIASPVAGMFIYNTDSSCICQYMGSAWRSMCGGNIGSPYNDWHVLGNGGTVDGTNFLGTTDNIPFSIRVNNQKAGRIDHLLNNSFFGYQSGNAITTGTGNSFFGHQSGFSNTTASNNFMAGYQAGYNNSVSNNHFVGYQAGYSNTSGYSNTFLGNNAGYSNTTGYSNMFVGRNSGRNNLIGFQNTFVGDSAGFSNTSNWNTAVGFQALYNSTGGSNTAIGRTAMYSNTTGGGNIAIGTFALYGNTTKDNNVAVGNGALQNNNAFSNSAFGNGALNATTSGASNSAFGYTALFRNITGSNNCAFGYGTSGNLTSASNNTAFGMNSGVAVLTGNNNTFLGYGADGTAADSFSTAIGYNAKVNASYALVLGGTGANAVNVGIGTATPNTSSVLDITSTTKGVIPPRLNTTQMNAIPVSAATNGMFIYNTDSSCYCLYNGTAWRSLCAGAINARSVSEWLDKDSLSGYTSSPMIYAKQALTSSQDTVAVFDDGSWYHADPGITQFSYGNSARNNNLFTSTKIPLASTGSSYNFSTYNNQIDNTSSAAGNATGISSTTYLPGSTARTGNTYGTNIQTVISGTAAHTAPIYAGNFQTSVYGSNNMPTNSLFGTQSLLFEGSAAGSIGTAYAANNQFFKSGTGAISTAMGANNFGWLSNNVGGSIGTLSGSMNQFGYPNNGVNNCTITTANAGQYYVGLGAVTGTGSFGTVNGAYIGLNLAATTGNAVPITTVNGLNIDFQSSVPDARITNVYGIKINNVTRGNVLNYSIYTGLGLTHFGDNAEITGTGYLTIPNGTTAQRPVAPVAGMTRFNNTFGVTEEFNGTGWEQRMIASVTTAAATTGTIAVSMSGISVYTITPSGACTFNATGGVAGQYCSFVITTTGTTSRTLTWGTNFKTIGTLATGTVSGKVFTVTFVYDGTNWNEVSRTTAM